MNNKKGNTRKYEYKFNKNPYPGLFIAIEGLDGSGNSTQASRVAKNIKENGKKVLLTREPTSGPVGAMIRMALEKRLKVDFETLQMMFTVDRADHIRSERGIKKRLELEEVVVSDRYFASTLAFGHASGLDVEWLSVLQSKFFLPDLTIFLDVSPKICLERIGKARLGFDLFEEEERLKKVSKGYQIVNKLFGDTFVVVNGEDKIDTVTRKVMSEIESLNKYKKLFSK